MTINGKKCLALFDTGSEISLVPKHFARNTNLKATDEVLHAANGTDIGVLGEIVLEVQLGNDKIPLECLVENVSEVLLGLEWLVKDIETNRNG